MKLECWRCGYGGQYFYPGKKVIYPTQWGDISMPSPFCVRCGESFKKWLKERGKNP